MSDAAERHLLYTELAKLLHSGFPVERATATLLKQRPGGVRLRVLTHLQEGLRQNRAIAEAMAPAVSGLEHSLLAAAEQGGRLGDGCEHLADYFRLLDQTRRRITGKLVYPLGLLHLIFFPAALPRLVLEGPVAFLWALLLPVGLLWLGIALLWWAGRRWVAAASRSAPLDRALQALPLVGRVRRGLVFARFSKVFQISLLAGRPISEALELAGGAAQAGAVADALTRIVPQVRSGEALGPLLQDEAAFPGDLADGFATAEESGTLDREAGRWAGYMQADAHAAAEVFSEWAPKILYGIAMVVVAYVIIQFWLGYFQQVGSLLDS